MTTNLNTTELTASEVTVPQPPVATDAPVIVAPAQDMAPATIPPPLPPVSAVAEPAVKTDAETPKLKRIIVSAFKPAQIGPSQGKFYISYVSQAGQEVTMPATEEIYKWTRVARPETECHTDWVINVDHNDVAVGVIPKPHLRQVLPSQMVTDGKHMVLVKSGQSYSPVQLPERFDVESLSEAIDLLSKTTSYRTGEKLGRFMIKQVVSDTESTYVALDLQ